MSARNAEEKKNKATKRKAGRDFGRAFCQHHRQPPHFFKKSWSKERINWNLYDFLHLTSTAHQVLQGHQVQAIIFDLDGTLIDFEGPMILTTAVGQGRLGAGAPKERRVLGFGLWVFHWV